MAVKIQVNGKQMVITADIEAGRPSKTGKTKIVASTNGFVSVDGGYKVSLNVIVAK